MNSADLNLQLLFFLVVLFLATLGTVETKMTHDHLMKLLPA